MTSPGYHREYNLVRYHRIREESIRRLGGRCVRCGSAEGLEIDHVDPSQKSLSHPLKQSLALWWEELKKCQLLCQTCHQEKTVVDVGKKSARGTHGTLSAYRHCGPPKCRACKDAKNEYMRAWKKRRRESIAGDAPVL